MRPEAIFAPVSVLALWTTNRVVHRVSVFALGNFVLLALWLLFIARIL